MSRRTNLCLTPGVLALPLLALPAFAQGAVGSEWRWLTFAVFAAIISVTMFVTFLAAKRVKSASDFYTAGGGVSGLQNGWISQNCCPRSTCRTRTRRWTTG